ncbi:MAG: hypothetical protein OHK0040_07830 [bacterium]
MGYRVALIFFLLLHLFPPILNAASADDKPYPVKIRTIGESPIINFIALDIEDSEELILLNSLSEEDTLNYVFFQVYIHSDDYKYLLTLLEDIKNKKLREKLLAELFSVSVKRGKLNEFGEVFSKFIDEEGLEKIKFLIALKNGNIESLSFRSNEMKALLNAYKAALLSDYRAAYQQIRDYPNKFPNTSFLFLLNAGMYSEALELISLTNPVKKNLFEAIVYYYQGDCNKVLEKLSSSLSTFEEKLLYAECGNGLNSLSSSEREEKKVLGLSEDPFLLFFNLQKDSAIKEKEIFQPYLSFYYSFQLKNFLSGLSIYKDEIERFVKKNNESSAELKRILTKYDKVWKEIDRSGTGGDLRRRVIDLEEKSKGMRDVSFSSSVDTKKAITFIDRQVISSIAAIKSAYLDLAEREEKELFILKKEIETRDFLKRLFSEKLKLDDYEKLLSELKSYYEIAVKYNLSVEEDVAYAKLALLWEYSQNAALNDKEKLWQRLVTEAEEYLKNYKDRKKEALLILAEALDNRSDSDAALRAFQQYLAVDTNPDARTLMKIGELNFEKGDYLNAIEFFKKAAQKSQSYKNAAYYKIGWAYYLLGQLTEVAELFFNYDFKVEGEKGILLFDEMMELLSRVFFKLGEDKIPLFLAKYPQFSIPEKLYKGVGDLHLFLADYNRALEIYEKGLNDFYLYEYSGELLAARIEVYSMLGKNDLANEEKYRFTNLYGKNSEYFKKFNTFPKQYRDFLYSAAVYYNVRFDKGRNDDDYKRCSKLYKWFLDYFSDDERAGEVSYYLGQLEDEKREFQSASERFQFAWEKGFRVENSLYRSLYAKYKLWKENKLEGKELIDSLKDYFDNYPDYEKTTSVVIVLSDMLLKEGIEEELMKILDRATNLYGDRRLAAVLDFCETNFKQISDKKGLAEFFKRGFEKLKDRRYLELQHYAIFAEAKIAEDAGKATEAKQLYERIIADTNTTSFREFALYNLALLLEKEGKVNEAVLIMKQIKEKQELAGKAKSFIYTFGKKEGLYSEAAEAALQLSKDEPAKELYYRIEAVWLFTKSGNINKANDVLNTLASMQKNERENADYTLLKGVVESKKGSYTNAFDNFTAVLKGNFNLEYEEGFITSFHETLKNTIFLKPEEEARDALEMFIEFLGKRFKDTGKPEYLFNIAETLSDFSLFFLQKEEALSKAVELYKRSLKMAANNGNALLVLKNMAKLKVLQPVPYAEELKVPEVKLNFLEDTQYDEVFTE